jgi:hypothetical protein
MSREQLNSCGRAAILLLSSLCSLCLCGSNGFANPPVASYIFPAGGQRGTTVDVRVGGLFLHKSCPWELLGPGVEADRTLKRMRTIWFEGPVLPLPDSQQAEDYPQDMSARVRIAADAPLGVRHGRLSTAEGAASGLRFVVGDLPEIVEQEIDGDPIPRDVKLPVTINGRIFPREDVDVWVVDAKKGQTIRCEVHAARLGSPLDSLVEVLDPNGRMIADNDDYYGSDSFVRFTATIDGKYRIRIRDANSRGGQAYVYRLTLTSDPWIDRAYPLGGKRGTKTRFEFAGQGLPAGAVEIALPADGPRDFLHRHSVKDKSTNSVMLDLDDVPEYLEKEPNDDPAKAVNVTLPAMLNGRIDRPGDVDCWSFSAKKGEALSFELRAAQLGSPLQGVVTITDATGKSLAVAGNEAAPARADADLRWTAPADGTYFVRISDRFRSRGGPDFAYRLRVGPLSGADFGLSLPVDALTVVRGGNVRLRIAAERLGTFNGPIALSIDGLPEGVKVNPLTLGAGQTGADLTFTAAKDAVIGGARLTLRGKATIDGKDVTHAAVLTAPRGSHEVDSLLLGVALPAPFKIVGDYDMRNTARGGAYHRKYRVERNGFDGPLEIGIADRQARHLQGVTGPTITVPAGATEFEYTVQLPPWMEIGRTCRVCVMGTAVVKDGEREHVVSYSSVQQNEQMIAVVETGRLGVDVEKTSLRATPKGTVTVPVKVARGKGLTGPVKVELVLGTHVHGVRAEALTIAAGETKGSMTLHFDERPGPLNMPILVRATLAADDGPAVAEVKIDLVPE